VTTSDETQPWKLPPDLAEFGLGVRWPRPYIPQHKWGVGVNPEEPQEVTEVDDYDRTHDQIERAKREAREDALRNAVYLHGEVESQPAFQSDEIEKVISDAERFYEYIWLGRGAR